MPTGDQKADLKAKLRERLYAQRISRTTKHNRERTVDQALKNLGIDQEKFKADLAAVKAQGGLTMNLDGTDPQMAVADKPKFEEGLVNSIGLGEEIDLNSGK